MIVALSDHCMLKHSSVGASLTRRLRLSKLMNTFLGEVSRVLVSVRVGFLYLCQCQWHEPCAPSCRGQRLIIIVCVGYTAAFSGIELCLVLSKNYTNLAFVQCSPW